MAVEMSHLCLKSPNFLFEITDKRRMQHYTLGNSCSLLACQAELVASALDIPWDLVKRAYKGIKNYPLPVRQQQYLKDRLLDFEPARLWRIDHPSILIYRFPNRELRFFLLSQTANICERVQNRLWYGSFPFIRECGDRFIFDLDGCPSVPIDSEVAWLPQSYNYSHFLCDFLSPWIPFADNTSKTRLPISVLSIDQWMPWQKDLIKSIGLSNTPIPSCKTSSLLVVKPKAVWLPVMDSTLISQVNLRAWLSLEFSAEITAAPVLEIPVLYLTRLDDRSARVRNYDEIKGIVSRYNGLTVDPATLTYQEKSRICRSARVIICEGSGSMNAVFFSSEQCIVIMLADPHILINPLFLDGGFSYLHLICHRLVFVVGESPQALPGSPLASCHYSIEQISQHINQIMSNNLVKPS